MLARRECTNDWLLPHPTPSNLKGCIDSDLMSLLNRVAKTPTYLNVFSTCGRLWLAHYITLD